MPRAGHPDTRPDESSVFISATDDMQRLASLLSTNADVAWIDGLVEGVSTPSVQHSIAHACNALDGDVTVVKHHPEQFLVTFTHLHHAIDAIGRGSLPVGRYNLQLRVGLENVPLHAWNEHTVSRIIGRASSLDYIEPRSLRKEDIELLWVWVWVENPSCIPKIKRVTMPARNAVASGGRGRGHRGLRYRVLIHLAQVEYFSSIDENGNPPPPYALPFKRGVVDGFEQQPRRHGSPRRNDDRRGRRDDDDRDERGGRDRSRG